MKYSTKDSELYYISSGTTEVKLTQLTDFSLDITRSTIDCSTLSTEWADSLPGIATGSGSMTLLMDSEDTNLSTIEDAVFDGTEMKFVWYPNGNETTGAPKYSFSAYLTSFNSSASVNAAVSIEVSFTVNGEITSDTVSA